MDKEMKLEKPIKISKHLMNTLNSIQGKMLFIPTSGTFLIIRDVEIEENEEKKIIKNWFRKDTIIKEISIFLTSISIWSWNHEHRFWGTVNEDRIEIIFFYYDLMALRSSYINYIKEPIEALGFEFKYVEKDDKK